MDDVPRIWELRESIAAARDAVAYGPPLPPNVHLVVTTEGGRSTGESGPLARQAIKFRTPIE